MPRRTATWSPHDERVKTKPDATKLTGCGVGSLFICSWLFMTFFFVLCVCVGLVQRCQLPVLARSTYSRVPEYTYVYYRSYHGTRVLECTRVVPVCTAHTVIPVVHEYAIPVHVRVFVAILPV